MILYLLFLALVQSVNADTMTEGSEPSIPWRPLGPIESTEAPTPTPEELMTLPKWHFAARAGFNIVAFGIAEGGISKNRMSPLLGLELGYHPSEKIFLFLRSEYTNRGARLNSNQVATASFLEFPFGIGFLLGTFGSEKPRSLLMRVGPFVSLPLGALSVGGLTIQETRPFLGGMLDMEYLVPVSEETKLGFLTWIKSGITSAYRNSSFGTLSRSMELGVGLSLHY